MSFLEVSPLFLRMRLMNVPLRRRQTRKSATGIILFSIVAASAAGVCPAQGTHGQAGAPAKAPTKALQDWKVSLAGLSAPNTNLKQVHAADASDVAGKIGIHLYRLDSVAKEHLVYVPRACEYKLCPLIVYLPWGGETAQAVMTWMHVPADKYGLIVLATGYDGVDNDAEKQDFDAALRQTLREFPVDRDKIAIAGNCRSGPASLRMGTNNPDIFTRIASISGGSDPTALDAMPPQSQVSRPVEFFIDNEMPSTAFKQTTAMEKLGYRVKHRVGWREHSPNEMYFDALGQWLVESWMIPNPADRRAPVVVANPLPKLTARAFAQMTDFWTRFQKEPAPISTVARETYRREVVVPVGKTQIVMTMMDVPALAARYPSVAAALKAAGLTAQQHEAYRVAIATALLDKHMLKSAASLAELQAHPPKIPNARLLHNWIDAIPNFAIDASSVQGANMAFIDAHPDDFNALLQTGMTLTP